MAIATGIAIITVRAKPTTAPNISKIRLALLVPKDELAYPIDKGKALMFSKLRLEKKSYKKEFNN